MSDGDIQLVIHPHEGIVSSLLEWALQFPHYWKHDLMRPYCWDFSASRFLRETELPWLLMVSGDHCWLPETNAVLEADADIVGTRYPLRTGAECHPGPDVVGLGCIKIRRWVLESMTPPWFFAYDERDGVPMPKCPCVTFCRRAKVLGATISKVGEIGHVFRAVFRPDGRVDYGGTGMSCVADSMGGRPDAGCQ